MKMKLMILSVEPKQYEIKRICEEAHRQGINCSVKNPEQLSASAFDFSHLLVRAIRGQGNLAKSLAKNAASLGIKVVDSRLALAKGRNKFKNYLLLKQAGLYIPKTELLENAKPPEFPSEELVIKPLHGKRGEDIHRIKKSEFQRLLPKLSKLRQYMVQEFVPIEKELRILVIGSKVSGAFRKETMDWVHNIARGAAAKPEPLTPELEQTALKAAVTTQTDIAGIDLAITPKGFFVLEVNRSPGFRAFEEATGINVAKEIVEYLKAK